MIQRGWRRGFTRLLLGFILVYGAVLTMMLWFENRLVYSPLKAAEFWEPPPDPSITDVTLSMPSRIRLHGWWYPVSGSQSALLICHGNGGNLSGRGQTMVRFGQALNRSVFIFDYPGYGKSEGKPSEAGCYAAAEVAYKWLRDQQGIGGSQIVLYGESLGGGVAVELATRLDHHCLILMKSFTSLPAVAKQLYPWLPTHLLMSNRFDNSNKLSRCTRPVLIAGATEDTLVPFLQSEQLFGLANPPKRLIRLEGDDHNSPLPEDFLPQLWQFLEEHTP